MWGTEETLRITIAAITQVTRETHDALAAVLEVNRSQVSRKQSGKAAWTLADVDRLAAHWGMGPLDLLAGPSHAVGKLSTVRTETVAPAAPSAPQTVQDLPEAASRTAEDATQAVRVPRPTPAAAPRPAARTSSPPSAQGAGASVRDVPASAPSVASAAGVPVADRAPHVASTSAGSVRSPRRAAPSGSLADEVRAAVSRALSAHQGDVDAARSALVKHAVPDVMALFAASRVGGRYEHSQFPPTTELLRKRSQKGADAVWEGRPKWRATELHRAARAGLVRLDVTALDVNAAYLAALKTHLPIGKLVHTPGPEAGLDPKRSGIHRITPAPWVAEDLPNPLGARKEPGDLWVTEPTLRLLLDCARNGLSDPPAIHESWVSGSTEGLLEKMRRALVEVRREAIANDDELTLEYVKSMYSKFVSTIGESSANREIRRPDWMHIIRSQAFANLWRKAFKAHTAGLTVVEMSGTDELHVAGDWQHVFTEGRELTQVKAKHAYTLGGDR